MAIDPTLYFPPLKENFAGTAARSADKPFQNQAPDVFSIEDTAMAPLRGIEGGVKGFYDFVDFVVGDNLPDYDTRFFGTSNTMIGGFVEGIAQFATGFVPVVGQLGKVGRIANARKFLGPSVAKRLAQGGRLTAKEAKKLSKSTKMRRYGDALAAGVASDFLMFDAQEARLSNLLYQYPKLQNPVTEYLQSTGDDGEIEGRFKNVLEGLFLEAGVTAVLQPFAASLKMIKNRNKKIAEGKSPEDAVDEAIAEADAGMAQQVNFNYGDLNDPISGSKGQPEIRAIPPEEIPTDARPLVAPEDIDGYSEIRDLESISLGTDNMYKNGVKSIEELAIKYNVELKPEEKAAIEKVKDSKLYEGVPVGKITDAYDGIKAKGQDKIDIRENLDKAFLRVLKAAREGREAKVKPSIELVNQRAKVDGYDIKLEKNQEGQFEIKATKDGEVFYENVYKVKSKKKARQAFEVELQDVVRTNAMTQVGNAKFLNEAAQNAGISVSIKDMEGNRTSPDHVEVSFLGEGDNQLSFKELPEELQDEVALYLKAKGGKVMAKSVADEVAIGKMMGDKGQVVDPTPRTDTESEDVLRATVKRVLKDKGPGGGLTALKGVIRTISEEKDFITIARALTEEQEVFLKENDKLAQTTKEELLNPKDSLAKITDELTSAFGGNKNNLTRYIKEMEGKAEGLEPKYEEMLKDQQAIRLLNNMIGEEISSLAKEASDAFERAKQAGDGRDFDLYDEKYAQMLQQMELMVGTQRIWGLYGRFPSLLMLQRRYIYQDVKSHRFDTSLNQLEKQSKEAISRYKDERRGSMGQQKLLQLVLAARTTDDIQGGLNKIAKASRGKRMFDIVREYWINSLLSGVSTFNINMIGSAITYAMTTLERAGGAMLTGNPELARATLRYAFDTVAVADAFDLAVRAAKSGEAISIPNSRQFDDAKNSKHAITSDQQNAFGTAINTIGTITRLPSRGLITGDEFFKALSYRSYVMTELALKGKSKNLSGKQLGEYVYKGVDAHVTETGRVFNEQNLIETAKEMADKQGLRFAEREVFITKYIQEQKKQKNFILPDGTELGYGNRGALAAQAEQIAKVNTHTQDSENSIVKGLSHMTVQNPWLTAIIPFVRTPTNLLTFGIQRSPFGMPLEGIKRLSKDYRETLAKAGPTERAELRGKMATSVASTAGLLYMFQSQGADKFISGYGPRDENQRKAWEMDNQQYSIKIGDKIVSYNRMDPMATMLGIIADISEATKYNEFDERDMSMVFGSLALAFSNNITNKSYVQGIDNLFKVLKDPLNNTERFVGSIAGGFVPNFVNQTMNVREDRPLREVRSIVDYMIKRIPGLEGKLPPRRNFLGEAETMDSTGGAMGILNPLYMKDATKNIVDYEFANLGAGFGKPTNFLRQGVEELDMKNYYNPETGQQSYDRMLELMGTRQIRGKTLRERLKVLFETKRYQDMPDNSMKDVTGAESPKVKVIRKLISAYRVAARAQTLRENPELYQRYITAKRAAR